MSLCHTCKYDIIERWRSDVTVAHTYMWRHLWSSQAAAGIVCQRGDDAVSCQRPHLHLQSHHKTFSASSQNATLFEMTAAGDDNVTNSDRCEALQKPATNKTSIQTITVNHVTTVWKC